MFQGDPLAQARQLIQTGALDEARRVVRRTLLADPGSASGLTLAGQIAIRGRLVHDALRHFERATLADRIEDPRTLLNLARAQELAGRTHAAIATARRAAVLFPDDPRPRGLAALLLAASGHADDAAATLRPGDDRRLDAGTAYKLGACLKVVPGHRELAVLLLARASDDHGPQVEPALRDLLSILKVGDPRRYDVARRLLVLAPIAVDAIDVTVEVLGRRRLLLRQAAWLWQSCCLRPKDGVRLKRAADLTWQVKWPRRGIAANRALLRDRPADPALIERVCHLYGLSKDQDAARAWGREILSLVPADARIWYAVAGMYKDVQAGGEAAELWPTILRRFPGVWQLFYNCALFLDEQDRIEDADRRLRQALLLKPDYVRASNQLSMVQSSLHRNGQAIRYVRRAIAAQPDYANAHVNHGMYLRFAGRYGQALEAFRSAERHAGADRHIEAGARYNAGMTKILLGELADGFRLTESRWALKDFPSSKRNFRQPIWPGPRATRDSGLLLYLEQGLGDEIMMTWVIPLLRRDVRRLVVDCDERLVNVLSRTYEGVQFVPKSPAGHPMTRDPDLDFKVPSFHVPQYYVPEVKFLIRDHWHWAERAGTRFPARFALEPERIERWRLWMEERFPGRRRIGLCWRSGHRSRDRDRHYLTVEEAAATIPPGSVVVNVQYSSTDEEVAELQELGRRRGFEFVTPEGVDLKNDLEEVMAILQNLDATVSAMTAVAWMSGAVGCPTYVFLTTSERAFWPQLGTPFVPWAPSFRLFRHDPAESWKATIDDISSAVAAYLSGSP